MPGTRKNKTAKRKGVILYNEKIKKMFSSLKLPKVSKNISSKKGGARKSRKSKKSKKSKKSMKSKKSRKSRKSKKSKKSKKSRKSRK